MYTYDNFLIKFLLSLWNCCFLTDDGTEQQHPTMYYAIKSCTVASFGSGCGKSQPTSAFASPGTEMWNSTIYSVCTFWRHFCQSKLRKWTNDFLNINLFIIMYIYIHHKWCLLENEEKREREKFPANFNEPWLLCSFNK